jgi:Type-A lantibiotic
MNDQKKQHEEVQELSMEDLDQVVGGAGSDLGIKKYLKADH